MRDRKEEILMAALHLFARDGYEAVSVSQIAGKIVFWVKEYEMRLEQ